MKNTILIFACLIVLTDFLWADTRKPASETPDVSIISLIANPSKYDGKYIRIQGVAYFDSGVYINGLFLSRDDKQSANGQNAIFIRFAQEIKKADGLNDKFVFVQGVFRSRDHGHLDSFAGSLIDVDRVEPVKHLIR